MSDRSLVPITKIRTDGGTQFREALDQELITDLALAVRRGDGDRIPDAVVFYDDNDYWLADGRHRMEGFLRAERKQMQCEVIKGTLRDAILYAAGANAAHGMRRTAIDKRNAVVALLQDTEWRTKSDRWIASTCKVSDHTVADIRAQLESGAQTRTSENGEANGQAHSEQATEPTTRTDRRGRKQPARKPKFVCEDCKANGIKPDCPKCKAGGGGKRKAGKRPVPNLKYGAVVVSWDLLREPLEKAYRDLPMLARKYGLMKPSGMITGDPGYHALERLLKELLKGGKKWCEAHEKKLSKKEKDSGKDKA